VNITQPKLRSEKFDNDDDDDNNNNNDNDNILGTAHILRIVPIKNYNRFNTDTNDISTMNSNNRIAATLYSLGT